MEFRFGATEIRVNVPDRAALETAVRARLVARQGFALATINLDHLVKLARSAEFRLAYGAQELVVADGNPIVWLSRLARRPVSLVPGSDMLRPLLRIAAETGVPVALVGSTDAALARAAEVLEQEIDGLNVTLKHAPRMGFDPTSDQARAVFDAINASGAGLCLLALGAPKQEILAARGRTHCPNVGFASIGAGIDFIAGNQRRAPAWIRRLALEWVWRMLSSPRRLIPRYAACVAILPGHVAAAWRLRNSGPSQVR